MGKFHKNLSEFWIESLRLLSFILVFIVIVRIEAVNEDLGNALVLLVTLQRLQNILAVLTGCNRKNDQLALALQKLLRILNVRNQREINLAVLLKDVDQLEQLLVAFFINQCIKFRCIIQFIQFVRCVLIKHMILHSAGRIRTYIYGTNRIPLFYRIFLKMSSPYFLKKTPIKMKKVAENY